MFFQQVKFISKLLKQASFLLIIVMLFNSCSRDNPTCFGTECFLGFYSANDQCVSGIYTYDPIITPSSINENEVFIDGFAGFEFATITAQVENNIISFGPVAVNGGLSLVEGAGQYAEKPTRINWNYTISEVGYYDNCSGVWLLQ